MECECISALITLFGTLIALVTICVGLYQYQQERRFKRLNHFTELRNRFKQNENFTEIRKKVLNNDFENVDLTKLYDYAGFFEELQISINSGFVDKEKVYYLFGHYILTFDKSELRKQNINKEGSLWSVYKKLITTMENVQNKDFSNIKF
jgi:hypothetical protein